MRVMKFISLAVILVMISAFAAAQQAPAQTPPTVKHVPITNAPSNSGKEMFNSYCAVCHGKDGKGNGPAASAMKTPPTDLTLLAQKNGGKYPAAHVAAVIRGTGQSRRPTAARICRCGVRCSPASARVTKPGAAENHQPGRVYRDPAGEVAESIRQNRSARRLRGAAGALRGQFVDVGRQTALIGAERRRAPEGTCHARSPAIRAITAQWSMSYSPLAVRAVTSVP